MHNILIQIGAFGKYNFLIKLQYIFSDSECPSVCMVWEVLNAIKIINKGRQVLSNQVFDIQLICVFIYSGIIEFSENSKMCFLS